MPALGAPTVVDTSLGGGHFLEPDGIRSYSLLALNETGELGYYRFGDTFADLSLRIKRPGTPPADLGVNGSQFLLGEALERDGDGRIFLFGAGRTGPNTSYLSAVTLGVAPVNLDLATQSGENFAVFQGLDINESALAIVIGLRSAFESLNDANTVLLYQYPPTDLAERVEVVLPLSEGRRVTAVAINNLGEYAYSSFRTVEFSSEDHKLNIHRADGSERIFDLSSVGSPSRLKLADTGEAFFLNGDGRLVLLPVDGAPIFLNQYFPEDFGLCGGFDVDKFGRRLVVTSQNQDKPIVLEKADSPSPT